jgi:hypothetical protein
MRLLHVCAAPLLLLLHAGAVPRGPFHLHVVTIRRCPSSALARARALLLLRVGAVPPLPRHSPDVVPLPRRRDPVCLSSSTGPLLLTFLAFFFPRVRRPEVTPSARLRRLETAPRETTPPPRAFLAGLAERPVLHLASLAQKAVQANKHHEL